MFYSWATIVVSVFQEIWLRVVKSSARSHTEILREHTPWDYGNDWGGGVLPLVQVSMWWVSGPLGGCPCPSLKSFHCCVSHRNWDRYDRAELVSVLFWTSLFVTFLITLSSSRLYNCKISAIFVFPFAAWTCKLPFTAFLWNSFLIIFLHIFVSSAISAILQCPLFHLILTNTYEVSKAEIVVSVL